MSRTATVVIEPSLELDVEYTKCPAESDVGIMASYASEVTILHPKTGLPVHQDVYDVLGLKVEELLLEKVNDIIADGD